MKFYPLVIPALVAASSIIAISAHAQEIDLSEIVVTPNRTPMEKSKVGSTVNIVSQEEIERQSMPLVVDYLNLIPGVSISSTGGRGSEGTLSIRGAPRRYVKTLYNGIDISDPTNTQVQTSYQYLLSSGMESIEVLKGSQSTLYGSDAMAGVISLSTLGQIEPGVTHIVHGDGGSFGTIGGSYGLRAANERSKFSFNAIGLHTDGISSADAHRGNIERDGYENITFNVNGEHAFSDAFSVFGSGLYIDAQAEFDNGFTTPPVDDLSNENLSRQLAGRAGFNLNLMEGRFRNTFSIQAFNVERAISTSFGDTVYDGERYKAQYQGAFDVNQWLTAQAGADYEVQKAFFPGSPGFSPDVTADSSITGYWGQVIFSPAENLTLTAGIRHDQHSEFGGHTTYRATGSYLLANTGTRLHGSFGTGFRAPSLYELFAPSLQAGTPPVGNPDLRPETSIGFDVGLEQRLLSGDLIADITYFQLAIDDQINCYPVGAFPCQYQRIEGTSQSHGVEASISYAVNNWLHLGSSYTYTHSADQNDLRLPQVPRHTISLTAVASPWERWEISAAARIALDTVGLVSSDLTPLDDYILVDAKIAYKATESTVLYLRAENLLNQNYQTVYGYGTPGFSVFAGFRAKFGG